MKKALFCALSLVSFAGPAVVEAQAPVDSTGIKLLFQRKFAEAEAFFESALKASPGDPELHYWEARALLYNHRADDAEDEIDKALEINDRVARYHYMRGQILGERAMNSNIFKQGILAPKVKNAFLRAAELDPGMVEAHVGLYNYYVMAPGIMGGSDEEALRQAEIVTTLDAPRGHILLANYHQHKNEPGLAEEELKKSIAAAPQRTSGYKMLGYLYVSEGKFDPAVEQFAKYVALDPKNPDAYDSYGDALYEQGKYDEAIEKYSLALSIDRNFSSSIFRLGNCYEMKGMKDRAVEHYRRYLSVDPSGRNAETAQKKIKELS
ncbi:MAG TPA: tetratricopeptide repeat protein [Bacteroidota bacterium]|nr:tetratricopeptide repeat protein [Bacteroidota bacterium]